MLAEKDRKAFVNFYDTVRDESVFDRKTTILIGLAASLSGGCEPCVEHYLRVAEENKISQEEIGAVQGICMAAAAGKINSLMRLVEQKRQEVEVD